MFGRKKKVKIKGYLMFPIKTGYQAVINEGQTIRKTSNVQRIRFRSDKMVKFDTCNTRYELKIKKAS